MRRWVVGAAVVVAAAGLSAGAIFWGLSGDRSEGSSTGTSTVMSTATASSAPTADTTVDEGAGAPGGGDAGRADDAVPSTLDPATLVQLDDVWLLDGGDGAYDWGIVLVGGDGPRRDIDVTVRLQDATGSVVFTATDTVSVLTARQRSAIGGTARSVQARPVRIEADVSVGFDASDQPATAAGSIDVRAVERRVDPRADDGSEVVTGRLRSSFPEPVEDLVLAAIWRAPADGETFSAGDIVAVEFRDVERVRPGVDARFEIPVTGRDVPSGPPDEVLVAM